MPITRYKPYNLTVPLNPSDKQKILELEKATGLTKTQIVRMMIRQAEIRNAAPIYFSAETETPRANPRR